MEGARGCWHVKANPAGREFKSRDQVYSERSPTRSGQKRVVGSDSDDGYFVKNKSIRF